MPHSTAPLSPVSPPSRARTHRWLGALALVGALLALQNSWSAHRGALAAERFVASLSARGEAHVEARLWQIEPVPLDERAATPPRRQARARVGARLLLPGEAGRAAAVVELRATGEPEEVDGWPWGGPLPLERLLGFSPADPASGLPRVEIVAPADWLARLRARPARNWPLAAVEGGSEPIVGSELAALRIEMDRPLEALARLWMRPEGNRPIRVHFDPAEPAIALPAATLGSGWTQRFLGSMTALLGGGGLGVAMLVFALARLSPRFGLARRLGLATAFALTTPLWTPAAERALLQAGAVGARFAHLGGDPASWITRGPVRLASKEEIAGERLVIGFAESEYAKALAPFRFVRPTSVAPTADAAWREVARQASAQTLVLDDGTLASLLAELTRLASINRREIAPAFFAALAELTADEGRPAAVRQAARVALLAALGPANAPRPGEFAGTEKLVALSALSRLREPAIASTARARLPR